MAKLAGLPGSVTRRAHEVLRALEASAPKNKVEQMDFDALQEYYSPAVPSEMMEKLETLDVETLTPIEALNFLYELKKKDLEGQPERLNPNTIKRGGRSYGSHSRFGQAYGGTDRRR